MNQDQYTRWIEDSLIEIKRADSKGARFIIEAILKETSRSISKNFDVPQSLIIYLISRFDSYFDKLETISIESGTLTTSIPKELSKALHLNNSMPKDHAGLSAELNILSNCFCEGFYKAQVSITDSSKDRFDRCSRLGHRNHHKIESYVAHHKEFNDEGFILGSSTNKKKLVQEDIKEAFIDILGIPEGTIKGYAKDYGLFKYIQKKKEPKALP
jgi:hypothetical protein